MSTCLVTTLKGLVDNFRLKKYGTITLLFPANYNGLVQVGRSSESPFVKYICDNGASFKSEDAQTDYGQEFTPPEGYSVGPTPNVRIVGGAEPFHVYIQNPENITRLHIPTVAEVIDVFDATNGIKATLRQIIVESIKMPVVDVADFYIPSVLIGLSLKSDKIVGDFADIPYRSQNTAISISGSGITGTLESYIEKNYNGIVQDGNLVIYSNSKLTFHGNVLGNDTGRRIVKTDKTVYVKSINSETTYGSYNGSEWSYAG